MHRALFFLPGPVSPYERRLWRDFLALSWRESTQGKGLPQMIVALVAMAVLGLAGLATLTQGISALLFGAMGAVLAWMACTIARPTLWPTLLTATPATMAQARAEVEQVLAQGVRTVQALVVHTHQVPPFPLEVEATLSAPPLYTAYAPFCAVAYEAPLHLRAWLGAEFEGYPWDRAFRAALGKSGMRRALLLARLETTALTVHVPPLSAHQLLEMRARPPLRPPRAAVFRCIRALLPSGS